MKCNKEEIDGSTKYSNGYCGGRGITGNDMVNEDDTEVDIDVCCYNCYRGHDVLDGCNDCRGFRGFKPRNDLVELQGKLRKAVEAIEKHRIINESWTTCDHDTELYKVLEELR